MVWNGPAEVMTNGRPCVTIYPPTLRDTSAVDDRSVVVAVANSRRRPVEPPALTLCRCGRRNDVVDGVGDCDILAAVDVAFDVV